MAEMTKERQGEIALALLKARFKREGINLSAKMRRELGNAAHETGIPREDLEQFTLELLPEMIGNALGFQRVSLVTKDPVPLPEHEFGHGH